MSKQCLILITLVGLSACTPMPYGGIGSTMNGQGNYAMGSGGLQIYPSSTSVGISQTMTFQVSGGTPPYQFQASGDGTVDASGDFQAGSYTGQAQVQATDSTGLTGSAMVSVVQSASSYSPYGTPYSYVALNPTMSIKASVGTHGWNPATSAELKRSPLIRGEVVAVEDQSTPNGDTVQSKFVETNLKHPFVRMDEWIKDKQVVAARAMIEDQFLAKLQPGYSEADLYALVSQAGARISRREGTTDTYLISMNAPQGAIQESPLNADFMAKRARLKQTLQAIASVSPNFVSSRSPAADPSQ